MTEQAEARGNWSHDETSFEDQHLLADLDALRRAGWGPAVAAIVAAVHLAAEAAREKDPS